MKTAGNVLAALAALSLPFLLALDYVKDGTGWHIFSGADVTVTVLAVIALALIAASVSSDSPLLSFFVLLVGVYVFAQMVPIEVDTDQIGIGAWLISLAALLLIVGGGMAVIGEALDDDAPPPADRGRAPAAAPEATAPTPAATAALADREPPAQR